MELFSRAYNALFGKESTPPEFGWPDDAHVQQAREAGHGYGTGYENFLSGDAKLGTVSHRNVREQTTSGLRRAALRGDQREVNQADRDALMAAMLAADKSPLASLGFDPHKFVVGDYPEEVLATRGLYYPDDDVAVNLAGTPSTYAHESTHRGYDLAKQAGTLPKHELYDEETIVRSLMQRKMGNPETGEVADRYRKQGNSHRDRYGSKLDDLVATLIKNRRPGGPR